MIIGYRAVLLMVAIAALGILASIHLYQWALKQDDEQIRAQAEFRAEWRATDLRWKLEAAGQTVASLAASISADPEMSVERLRRLNAEPLRRMQSMTAIGWVARVPGPDRARFEAEMRAAGLDGFRILEPRAGNFVPAAERDEYFPLIQGWIFEGAPAFPGYDALADSDVRAAAHAARDSGKIGTTVPLRSAVTGQVTLQILAPVYAGLGVPGDIEERRIRLRGFVVGRIPLMNALNQAIEDTPAISGRILIFLDSPAADGRARTFAEYRPDLHAFVAADEDVKLSELPGYVAIKPITLFNTQWTVAFHFRPDVFAAERSAGLWGLLVAGLLVTAGTVFFLGSAAWRTARSQRLVVERTADLRHEIDERRRIEQTSTAIIEQSPFAIVGVSPDREVMLWNQAAERIFGYAAAEAVGKPYALVPSEGQAEFDRIIERVSSGKRLVDVEVRRRRKDGTLIDIVFSGAPLYDNGGALSGLIFVLQDITERKAIEAQLRQSQKMEAIGQLSGGIAHDFNNMLGAIIGNLEIAQDEKKDVARIHEQIGNVIEIAVRGGQLVQRLLAFARRQMLAPKLVDVATVVDGMVPLLKRTIGESIEIRGAHDAGIWAVVADPSQLESAILNLAINARDAMPSGGSLTITATNVTVDADMAPIYPDLKQGDYVLISVADTGTGMTPDVVARAFEPFFTTKDVGKGTGLGLAMVYGFLRQSGGTAKIYSELGHGTTIHLYLPRAQATEQPQAAVTETEAPRGSERVLLVEDNAEVRDVASVMLGNLGYEVVAANDGIAALALVDRGERFDLLFSDAVMPGMSGIELAKEVRRRRPGMPMLLTSGFASPVAVRDEVKAEGIAFLAKPYRRVALASKIREVIDAKS